MELLHHHGVDEVLRRGGRQAVARVEGLDRLQAEPGTNAIVRRYSGRFLARRRNVGDQPFFV